MLRRTFLAPCWISLLLLSACGGGGGGGGTPAPPAQQLQLSTAQINFAMHQGGGVPPGAPLSGTVSGNPAAVFATVTITTNGIDSYLTPQINGSAVSSTIFAKPAFSLQAGTYRDTITVQACPTAACTTQFAGSPATVNVTYAIGLDVSVAALTATVVEGATPAAQNLDLRYYGGNGYWTAAVAYTAGNGWLNVPASGSTLPATLAANFTAQPAGTYTGTLNLSASATGFQTQTRALPVTYTVQPLLQVAPIPAFSVTNGQPAAGQTRSSAVTSADAARNTGWTAIVGTSSPWLQLTTATGTTGAASTLQLALVATEVAKLRNGTYVATVTVDPALAAASTVEVPVTLTIDRTHVATVAPYVAAEGRTGEVIVRGSRFNDVAIQGVQFGAFAAVSLTVDGPTRLRATHPVLAAGRYSVTLVTTAGSVGSSAELVVVDAQSYAGAGKIVPPIPFGFRTEFDPERRACYQATFDHLGASFAGVSSWTTLVAPTTFGLIDDLVLTADGRELLVADGAEIVHLDPTTLVEKKRVRLSSGQRVGALARLDDGRIAFNAPNGASVYQPWTGADDTLQNVGFVGSVAANITGNKLVFESTTVGTAYRVFDLATSATPWDYAFNNLLMFATDRLGTRWAFTPTSAHDTVITDETGHVLGQFAAGASNARSTVMTADGSKLIVGTSPGGGGGSYRVFGLPGGAMLADKPVTVVPPIQGVFPSELLDYMYLTPHENEVLSCAPRVIGATAID